MPRHPRFTLRPSAAAVLAGAALCALSLPRPAQAGTVSEEDELAQAYGETPYVSIATGSRQPVTHAPAIATVITADEIAAMGATDLDEVLETVPGVHVARFTQGFSPVYVIRGVNLGYNPQVLMLINGVPITKLFAGNRGNALGGFPLENVARIEVIRGPGSALYGADAAAGVINVITKTATDVSGTTIGLRGGSFQTRDGWALYGGSWGPVQVESYLRVGATDGERRVVQADAQTGLDHLTGTQASLAPGPIDNQRHAVDASVDLHLESWRLRLGYVDRGHIGSGTGVASALDPSGNTRSRSVSADLSYDALDWVPDWTFKLLGSHLQYSELSDLTLFPAGANLGGGTFADGMIGNPYKWERRDILSADANYMGWRTHRVRVGVGAEWADLYKVRETKNFNPDFTPIGTGSRADVVDVSTTAPFLRPHSRQLKYVYGQDEWHFSPDWTLTVGLRHDDYSDFGSTTNPRAALVWDVAYDVTARLLYGTAFRAPSFTELYAVNNPVANGNARLLPEKTKSTEAAISWQLNPRVLLGVNVFHFQMDNIIQLVDFVYQNTGSLTGNGLECEASWSVNQKLQLSGNYSYQYARDAVTRHDSGNAPHHQVYVRADWRFTPGWALDTQINAISARTRVPGDTRPSLSGYQTVDLTLRSERDWKGWHAAVSVRNLFDADAREPSPFDASPTHPFISLPNDIPLPGRSFYVQATYTF